MTNFRSYQILYVESDFFLLYKNLTFFLCNTNNSYINLIGSINTSFFYKLLSNIRITNRLFRLNPRATAKLCDGLFVVSLLNDLWVIDTYNKLVKKIDSKRYGFSTPLNLCQYNQVIIWGDYGVNVNYNIVNLYSLTTSLKKKLIYQFPKGSIRHVHNIVFDEANVNFWILTGDNECNAGIYKANKYWQDVMPVKIGQQKYRAVIGFPYNNGFIYATDSVEKENFLYYIRPDLSEEKLCSINGSCIYGIELRDYFIFSTTVESPEGNGIRRLFSTKLGGGIKDYYVHLISVRKSDLKVTIFAKYKKDWLPMKLFQYGCFVFPGGQSKSNNLWTYAIALNGIEGKNLYFSEDDLTKDIL